MYKCTRKWHDLTDGNYQYFAGDKFPREGLKVSKKRIAELSGDKNKLGVPLIKEVKEDECI